MLNKIIEFSVNNKLIIGLFTIGLVVAGIFDLTKLHIDAVPDITDNQIQIITVAPSLGATDIERLVTFPVELENSNISGITEIRSFSRFGLSLVTIVFDEKTDIYWARQQVAERLLKVQNDIPEGVGIPEMGPVTTGLGEIYQYIVRAKKGYEDQYDLTELRTIQDWIIRQQLLGVKGVAEVSSFGGKLKQFEIAVNTNKLHSFDLTLEDIFSTLEKNNQNTGGTYIEKGPGVLFIRSEGLAENIGDLKQIAVTLTADKMPVLLQDVADVRIGYATRFGAMTYNDEGEVAGAIVMMLKDENSSEVIKNVKERIAAIQETLPEGVIIEPFLDRTKMVNNAISTIKTNLSEGALIVVFILVFFLGNFRAGFLVASVIPLSMLFAVIMMNIFGVSGNLMSLGALDFGLIVDGAVIIVEAVLFQLHSGKKYAGAQSISQDEMNAEVKSSASKMVNSAVFGQIIILIVYLPLFTLQGIEGKMFIPMAQTVSFALIGAFILSLTYIPMMSSLVLSKSLKHDENFSDRMMKKLENIHQRQLSKVIHLPKTVISGALVLFAFSLFLFTRLGGEFIPSIEEGDFAVETWVLPGSNLQTTIDFTTQAAGILKRDYPEVEKVVTKIGNSEIPTDPMPLELADMMIILKDKKEWTSAKTFPELAEKMGQSLEVIPGITTGFQYPVQMRFNELMTGARQDVVSKIFGDNLDSLAVYAKQLGDIVNTIDGAEDLYIETVTGLPEIIVRYKRPNMAQYGLTVDEVNRLVNTAFAGQSAGTVYEGERRFDLVLRLDEKQRQSLEDIQNLLVPVPGGGQIPLYQVADVTIENGPSQIQREDAKRRILVGFNVRGRDVQTIVEELQTKAAKNMTLPPGYYVTYGGSFENLIQAKNRLMVAVPIALSLIFIMLYFAFRSIKQSVLIYTAIPLSAIGGILFLTLRGLPFSISAGVGFIALFGVAVLNGIILIAEFNRLKKAGETDLYKIALAGSKTRLRPVLMTASVASLGFLPMALSRGAGAEVQRPLATVVIGGLIIATYLTLFVLPTLFVLFEKIDLKKWFSKKAVSIVILALFLPAGLAAQTITISPDEAVEIAHENNLTVKNKELISRYYSAKKAAWFDLPQTEFTAELGQINGPEQDDKLGITQNFNFPVVYARQKQLYSKEWEAAVLAANLSKADIQRHVTLAYYQLAVLKEQKQILEETDNIYDELLKKVRQRFESGETDILELTAAEVQRDEIGYQLTALYAEIELARMQFRLLLNADTEYEPEPGNLMMTLPVLSSESSDFTHPEIEFYSQELETAKARLKLEKSHLLPELKLGYFNQSFNGLDNKRYGYFEIGIGIPLFFNTQRSHIKAEQLQIKHAGNELAAKLKEWEQQYQTASENTLNRKRIAEEYSKKQLPRAELITEAANKKLLTGEINYLEWVLLTRQAVQIKTDYLNRMMQYNESAIQLQYLLYK